MASLAEEARSSISTGKPVENLDGEWALEKLLEIGRPSV